ncbi:MAG TPA: hypothetical protein VGN68_10750 [Sphingopyxis sp.]|jgi:hypothetical protein|uniref:hypothetical protein n=1 Tax=Sphingopyxis sp. TaxID=1908224 RepID=UPI002E144D37|nr:hypothetical protein [Sphingopyxis sp.]
MTSSVRSALTAAALLTAAWAAPATAQHLSCPPGSFPGQQTPGTENSGLYITNCIPDPNYRGEGTSRGQPIEAWRRILPPLTRPPKGWQPLWLAFREYKDRRTRESHYIAVAGYATHAEAMQAYEAECERVNGPHTSIGSCKGWGASQYAYFAILRRADREYTIGYGNSPEETVSLGSLCDFYARQARELGRTELLSQPCALEIIGIYRNAIVPEPKRKRKR